MAAKTDAVVKLLDKVELGWTIPTPVETEGTTLLEQGLHAVLMRHFDAKKAGSALKHLKAHYPDWNEVRVAQYQEIVNVGKLGVRGRPAAQSVKTYLQEVFQQTHGLDLEFMRNDAQATAKFVSAASFLGLGTSHFLMWLAHDGEVPITPGLVRVVDRLGLAPRTASIKKARTSVKGLLPDKVKGGGTPILEFLVRFGEVASRWCDPRKPLCHLCPLKDDCKQGRKVYKDWVVQQERLEAQRARDAAREEAALKKEEARQAREAERARKKSEADAKKKKRELERRRKIDLKRKEAEAKKKAKVYAVRKREADLKKKAAAKKAASKKKPSKKKTTKKATRKPAKKTTKKKVTKKKASARKPAKKTTKKKVTKKKSTKKATRKPAKKATKKTTKKKVSKKKASPKKPARKKTTRRR